MKHFFILFVMLVTAATAQAVNFRPFPASASQALIPGYYTGYIVLGGTGTGSALGNAAYRASHLTATTTTFTWPVTTSKVTYIIGRSSGGTYQPSTWLPLSWHVAQVVGDGVTSPSGPFVPDGSGGYTPVDGAGNPVDPGTGVPLPPENPTPYTADFDLSNPHDSNSASYAISISFGPGGGDSYVRTLGPGEIRHEHLEYWVPFTYAIYPIVDGSWGDPGSDGNPSGGTGAQPPGFTPPPGAPGGGTGAPVGGSSSPGGTKPPTPGSPGDPPPADTSDVQGNVQAEIQRLEGIIQNAAADAKNAANLSLQELTQLNAKAAAAKTVLDAISASNSSISGSAATIAAGVGTTNTLLGQTNTLLGQTNNLISELDNPGTFEGLTADQLGDLLDEREGTSATTADPRADLESATELKRSGFHAQVAALAFHFNDLTDSVLGLKDNLGLGISHAQTPWAWSVSVPIVGALNVNVESRFGWVLDLMRGTVLAFMSWAYCRTVIRVVRDALV